MAKDEVPEELREELLRVALATDVAARWRLAPWRVAAVCAARWLLRAAALADRPPAPAAWRALADVLDRTKAVPDEVERERSALVRTLVRLGLAQRPS